MKTLFAEERKNFPIFERKIQLSSCSQSALHIDVKRAIQNYIDSWETNGMDWEGWVEACENARALFAKMIHAEVDEIAIVSSVSHALSSVASTIVVRDKKKVLVSASDFPTVGHIWLSHNDQFDIQFVEKNDDGFITIDEYKRAIDEETFIVNIPHVYYYNGYKQDIKEIASLCHEKGAYLFVDAYQSFGQTPINVKEMNIDMLSTGLQKYALGVPGIAFLYIDKNISSEITPKMTGWFGQRNPFAFDIKQIDYAEHTRRFDSGTFPMMNGFAVEAGLNVLDKFNIYDIEEHLQQLSVITMEEAKRKNLLVKSPTHIQVKASNTAIYVENADEVEKQMLQEGYVVSARNDVIRIAPHFYNTADDVRGAVETLSHIVKKGQ